MLSTALSLLAACLAQQPEPRTIAGQVVDLRGDASPAAEVWVEETHGQRRILARSAADGEGQFRIGVRALSHQELTVCATTDGMSIGSVAASGDPLRIAIHDATRVRGVVLDRTGAAAADLLVGASSRCRTLGQRPVYGRSDENGRFTIDKVPLGHVFLTAWIPGEGLALQSHRVAGEDRVELRGHDAKTRPVAVRIRFPEGTAPFDIPLELGTGACNLNYVPAPHTYPVARDGLWALERAPEWTFVFRPRAAGYTFEPRFRVVGWSSDERTAMFEAQPYVDPRPCIGIVRDENLQSRAGLTFEFEPRDGLPSQRITSDGHGRVAFETGLPAGRDVVIRCVTPGWVLARQGLWSTEPIIGTRHHMEELEFEIPRDGTWPFAVTRACSIDGQVLSEDGRPVHGVHLVLQGACASGSPKFYTVDHAVTDNEGRYHFKRHLAPGAVRVAFAEAAGTSCSAQFSIDAPGERVFVPKLRMPQPAHIEGVVRDERGRPIAGMPVRLQFEDRHLRLQILPRFYEGVSDREGRYRITVWTTARARIRARPDPDDYAFRRTDALVELVAGETTRLDLTTQRD